MASLEDNTVYLTLESRGVLGTFHWSVYITSLAPQGQIYHATTKFGGWQLEARESPTPLQALSLVIIYKIGSVLSPSQADQVLRSLPADGSPSLRTGEEFTCRIWIKDALMALSTNQLLTLKVDIDTLEKKAFKAATRLEPDIERGLFRAPILDSSSA